MLFASSYRDLITPSYVQRDSKHPSAELAGRNQFQRPSARGGLLQRGTQSEKGRRRAATPGREGPSLALTQEEGSQLRGGKLACALPSSHGNDGGEPPLAQTSRQLPSSQPRDRSVYAWLDAAAMPAHATARRPRTVAVR